ncbi:MAG TPA: exostosin family protein [Chthoniobacteraceae bacterium]|jgi:hypothetical protein
MSLRLHCDRSLVPEGCNHVPLLDPFWGLTRWDPEGNLRQSMEPYVRAAGEVFVLTASLAEADAGLVPVDWAELLDKPPALEAASRYLKTVKDAGLQAIVFFGHDAPIEIDWPEHAVVFRIAVHRRRRKPMEFIVPQWSKDYLADEMQGELSLRTKRETPTVGFCGFAPPLGLRFGKRWAKETARLVAHHLGSGRWMPTRTAHAARARALIALRKSSEVAGNFIVRGESAFDNQYGAFLPGGTVEAAKARRLEFAKNIVESDYVLCSRGWANCSIRFYETLSLGRAPLLVDTDCVLPFENDIDWKKRCILVPENDLGQIGRRVREFHDALSADAFAELQRGSRKLYEEWLSPLGFFRQMHRCLRPAHAT